MLLKRLKRSTSTVKSIRRIILGFCLLALLVPAFSIIKAGGTEVIGGGNIDGERYLQQLKMLRQKRPDNPEYSFQLGNLYYSMKMQDDAIKEYRRTLRLDRGHQEAKWFLSHALADKGYCEEAFRLVRELLDVRAEEPELYFWAGEILVKLGQNELAKEYFARVDDLTFSQKTQVTSIKPVVRE